MRIRAFSRKAASAAVAIVAGSAVAIAPSAFASPAGSHASTCRSGAGTKLSGSACTGLGFYKGKTLTIDAATVGGGFDTTARVLAPALSKYLQATVNVVNYPGGAGVPPQNAAAGAVPDGLTIGFLFPLSSAIGKLMNIPDINFNPKHEAFLAGTGPSVQVLVANPNSKYKSFNSLKDPGVPADTLTEGGGTTYDTLVLLKTMFNLNLHFVTGYSSVGLVLQGFIRGDGPVSIGSLSNLGPAIAGGKALPLAVTAKVPPGTDYRSQLVNTPTIAQLLAKLPAKTKQQKNEKLAFADLLANTGQPIFTQGTVPAARVAALRAALKWAYTQPSVKSGLLAKGDTDVWVPPVKAKTEYDDSLTFGKTLVPALSQYLHAK